METYDFLFVNPWIYDFAAYDFWLKPFGLLLLAGKLKALGYKIKYLDLLDPFHPDLPKPPKRRQFGTGHLFKIPFPKPVSFSDVPRNFFRYGLPTETVYKELSSVKFKAVFITCTMTYWYPGMFAIAKVLTQRFPDTPIFLGGIYIKLCKDHALNLVKEEFKEAPVYVITENHQEVLEFISKSFTPSGEKSSIDYPAFYLQRKIPYVVIVTSFGCPFNCPYCASKRLYKGFHPRDPKEVIEEISFWYTKYQVKDFAFYDDALLFNFDSHLGVILEALLSKGLKVRFHTPNAVHARFISGEVARLLKKAGFETIRLGLERVENRFDDKVSIEEFLQAVSYLKEAGFKPKNLGAYFLYGVPDENFEEVKRGLLFLEKCKVPPHLAEYSPIPGTPFFKSAVEKSRYPLQEDPIFHNNTVFPALRNPDWEEIQRVKSLARKIRRSLISAYS